MKKVVSILMLSGLILVLSCGFVLAAEEAAKAPQLFVGHSTTKG